MDAMYRDYFWRDRLPRIPKAPKAVQFEKKRGGQGNTTRDGISYGAEGYIYERQLTISFNLGWWGGGGFLVMSMLSETRNLPYATRLKRSDTSMPRVGSPFQRLFSRLRN